MFQGIYCGFPLAYINRWRLYLKTAGNISASVSALTGCLIKELFIFFLWLDCLI